VYGIIFIRYAQSQKTGEPNNLKVLGARRPKHDRQNNMTGKIT
jgi:hypothetical protein